MRRLSKTSGMPVKQSSYTGADDHGGNVRLAPQDDHIPKPGLCKWPSRGERVTLLPSRSRPVALWGGGKRILNPHPPLLAGA